MFNKDNLHHAYVLEGDSEVGLRIVRNFLKEELEVALVGNADLYERMYEGFGINDAREIRDNLNQRRLSDYKIFILTMSGMTNASANALLKSLEEPPNGTHFFILIPNSKKLVDTLLSRVVLIKLPVSDTEANYLIEIKPEKFISLAMSKRLEVIKDILSQYDKENISKLEIQSYFKNVLIQYKKIKKHDPNTLKNAIYALDYMSDQSSSLKIIIEYITLILV